MAYRPTEKTEARRVKMRQALLDAALLLISRGGFGSISVKAVARHAGLATGSVYKHFESKAQLCAEIFRLASEAELARVRTTLCADGSATDRLVNTIEQFSLRAIRGRRLAYALIAEPADPAVDAERIRLRRAYTDAFASLVADGIAREEFKPQEPVISAAALVGVISEALVGPLSRQNNQEPIMEKKQLVGAIQAFCLRAVGARIY